MVKKREKRPGYGRLLELWEPPDGAGEAIGCVATSFSFHHVFFEEECLGRFVGLQSDPQDDVAFYLLEREEKLSNLACKTALVDARNCRGTRSLRWDLLPARVPGAAMHAKVTLLHWTGLTRIIVSSANLTEDGYRRNREVFGAVDFWPDGEAPRSLLLEIVEFLRYGAGFARTGEDSGDEAVQRLIKFLDGVKRDAGSRGDSTGRRQTVNLLPVFVGPGRQDAFQTLKSIWPGVPPYDAYIVSPFFDPPGAPNEPAKRIWDFLRQRGDASLTYHLDLEKDAASGKWIARAPESIVARKPSRESTEVALERLVSDDGATTSARPLHMKSIWIENDQLAGYLVGSSNFTSPGLGLSKRPNVEANIFYIGKVGSKAYNRLCESYPDTEEFDGIDEVHWLPDPDETDKSAAAQAALPDGFKGAFFGAAPDRTSYIRFTFGDDLPEAWSLFPDEDEKHIFFSASQWEKGGRKSTVRLPWTGKVPPSGFSVIFDEPRKSAWWTVNVVDSTALPPPEELAALSLDELVEILSSARPLHQVMRKVLKRRKGPPVGEDVSPVDFHKRVDTSVYLIQRTRRVSRALSALKERLERPAATLEGLEWRLRGPVGVKAVAESILGETTPEDHDERGFLLAELCLELGRAVPKKEKGFVNPGVVRAKIGELISEIASSIPKAGRNGKDDMGKYVRTALREASR